MTGQSPPPITPLDDYIVHAKDFPVQTVYSWERDGEFFSLYPADRGKPPYDATEIFVRLYAFPDSMVREIYLNARSRTHHHVGHEDILFYQVSGRRVQIVNERSHELNPGDASLQISGVWKRVDQIIPGVFIEFSMPRPASAGAEATWVTAGQAEHCQMAEWTEGLRSFIVQGAAAAAAPANASRYQLKTFAMQGYYLHEIQLPKGARISPRRNRWDTVFYVVDGRMKAQIGETRDDVEKSDAMRAPAGVAYDFESVEDCKFIFAHIPPTRPDGVG